MDQIAETMPKSFAKQFVVASGTTIAVIPAHNDVRLIGSRVLSCQEHVDSVIVVDQGSTDGTGEVARLAGAITVEVPVHTSREDTVGTGLIEAIQMGAAAVVVLDNVIPSRSINIPLLLTPILDGSADIVIGGASYLDLRAFSPKALQRSQINGIAGDADVYEFAAQHQLRVVGVPPTAPSSTSSSAALHQRHERIQVFDIILRTVAQNRPLLFFGLSGLMVLVAGLGLGLYILNIYVSTQVLAIGYAMLTVLLCIVGTLLFLAGVMLHSIRSMLHELQRSATQRPIVQ